MNNLFPANYKYTKIRKRNKFYHILETNDITLKNGIYGLKALESGQLSAASIEAARKVLAKKAGKMATIYVNIFPDIPITKKSSGIRMGKGYGSIFGWVKPIKKGKILFELKNISYPIARYAFLCASHKLSVKCKFIKK